MTKTNRFEIFPNYFLTVAERAPRSCSACEGTHQHYGTCPECGSVGDIKGGLGG